MIENIEVLFHSSIRINKEKVIYIDPYKINKQYKDADIIFVTHSHFDHYSPEDIEKVKKEDTIVVAPKDLSEQLKSIGFDIEHIIIVKPEEQYNVLGIKVETVCSYNINKQLK